MDIVAWSWLLACLGCLTIFTSLFSKSLSYIFGIGISVLWIVFALSFGLPGFILSGVAGIVIFGTSLVLNALGYMD